MSSLLTKLSNWGCDVQGAMKRVLDDEEFYLSCIEMTLTDDTFDQLGAALDAHNISAAFDAAHTLKGVTANMGLTPLYTIVVKIVEPLRIGKENGTGDAYQELLQKKAELAALVQSV